MENHSEALQRRVQCALKKYYHITPSGETLAAYETLGALQRISLEGETDLEFAQNVIRRLARQVSKQMVDCEAAALLDDIASGDLMLVPAKEIKEVEL